MSIANNPDGFADPDGDLDLEYKVVTQDVLGAFSEREVRLVRDGCLTAITTITPDELKGEQVRRESGTYVDDRYTFTFTEDRRGDLWQGFGTRYQDFTSETTLTLAVEDRDAEYVTSADSSDGTSVTTWTDERRYGRTRVTIEGVDERFRDGSLHRTYDYSGGGNNFTIDYTMDYAGNGSGELTASGGSCPITVEDGYCEVDCGPGNRFEC